MNKSDPRFKARIAIYNGPGQKKLISNYSVNMSTGGMFIETVTILPVDTLLAVKFKLPDNDTIITCKARVAWTNEPGNLRKFSLPPGMGLQFLDLPLKDMHVIREYLNNDDFVPTW
jgi:uncharacterized protein (TIGR02266 family)